MERGSTDAEVVVVGAGLAGLRCASALAERGRDVVVLEAADVVGGRVATDRVDGFLADRGFQLLNPAYPAVRRWVDVDALRLQPFGAGVVATDVPTGRTRTLGDPLREPGTLPATLWGALGAGRAPRDAVALTRWAAPLLRHTAREALRPGGPPLASRLDPALDLPLTDALDAVGAAGELRRVLERFLSGVVLDDSGATSSQFVLLLLRSFLTGRPSLPAGGMAALPAQLAAPLGERVRLGCRVAALEHRGGASPLVRTADGALRARAVVVATDPRVTETLTGVPAPRTRGVTTCWWAVDEAPTASGLLHVDAGDPASGPVVNTAVVSHAAPSYAPPGRHLVQASALLDRRGGRRPTELDVRRHAARLLGARRGAEDSWQLLVTHEVDLALPAQPAPLSTRRPTAVPGRPGLHLAGDHRDTASIQGALVSGERAARAVLAELGDPVEPAAR
ncbi:FAD-dependent oxidoreductase [Nocardioides sp. CFH 31398]|nr:NAD(P)/FAD-dependent oxidoreductase [Nocardioides sp. CFH 31398]MCH1865660.1 FAD-dependent oxidoreductase [Nocardioides sp. CFH 31398]